MFNRTMRRVTTLCDEAGDYYDCDGCTWEGIEVSQGDVEAACEAFEGTTARSTFAVGRHRQSGEFPVIEGFNVQLRLHVGPHFKTDEKPCSELHALSL
jgi:hypothetical protein